jgi:hypothetical protein
MPGTVDVIYLTFAVLVIAGRQLLVMRLGLVLGTMIFIFDGSHGDGGRVQICLGPCCVADVFIFLVADFVVVI